MIVDEVDESTALVVRGACVRDGHFVADDQAWCIRWKWRA